MGGKKPGESGDKEGDNSKLEAGAKAVPAKPAEAGAERRDAADAAAADLAGTQEKAGKLHEAYLNKTSEIKDSAEAQNKLRSSSIADVRYNTALLNGVQENKDPKQRALNLKSETTKRLAAYTSGRDKDWYILDYESMGSDQDGLSHEMNIGLGDVLLDPDITNVLIEKDGVVIKAHRGIVSSGKHAGRVGFLNENNEYVATFTGDKFKILSDNEVNLGDEGSRSAYIKAVESEDSARASHSKVFEQEVKTVKEGNADLQESGLFNVEFKNEGSVVDQIAGDLSARQLANARIIEEEFKAAGLQNSIVAAAIINAYVESGLKEDIVGDSGRGAGLFGLHERGAGYGMSLAERKDPRINAKTILKFVLGKSGARLRREAKSGASVLKLAIIFSQDVERPKSWRSASGTRRATGRIAGIAKKLFGGNEVA